MESTQALGMIEIKGLVGSIEAAAASRVGEPRSVHVIPRPHGDVEYNTPHSGEQRPLICAVPGAVTAGG